MANADLLWRNLNRDWPADKKCITIGEAVSLIPLGSEHITKSSSYQFAILTLLSCRRNFVDHKDIFAKNAINSEVKKNNRRNYIWNNFLESEIYKQEDLTNLSGEIMMQGGNDLVDFYCSHNIIFYGPPGTGKTFSVIDYAYAITNKNELVVDCIGRNNRKNDFDNKVSENQIIFVTFHQSFSYEEFIEGIRAETVDGNVSYSIKPGKFKSICEAARNDENKNYVLIIDEINRGNVSKIFGELITLIEPSKREGEYDSLSVVLPYSGEQFSVPKNLYIIGTMNTADRSLALMDTALRRRFDFVEMMPKPDLLNREMIDGVDIQRMLEVMNNRIEILYDREHTLGHAFFMHLTRQSAISDLSKVFELKIIPLLQEYFFEDWSKIRIVLGDDRKTNQDAKFVKEKTINGNLFTEQVINELGLNEAKFYELNSAALSNPQSYIAIYQ